MSGEICWYYKMLVEIQDNGIIRDPEGYIIGRCNDDWLEKFKVQHTPMVHPCQPIEYNQSFFKTPSSYC